MTDRHEQITSRTRPYRWRRTKPDGVTRAGRSDLQATKTTKLRPSARSSSRQRGTLRMQAPSKNSQRVIRPVTGPPDRHGDAELRANIASLLKRLRRGLRRMARNKRMNGRLRGRPPRIPVESMDLVAMADASPKKIPPSQCQVSEAATIATLTFGSLAEDVKVVRGSR